MAEEAQRSALQIDVVRALRDAAWTGLIAFGLLLPLIGFNTVQNIRNELVLETRWPLLIVLVAIIAAGRLVWELLPHQQLKQGLSALVRSPRKLAATAAACWLIAILARTTVGAVAEAHVAFRMWLMVVAVIAGLIGTACTIAFVPSGPWRAIRPPPNRAAFAGTRSGLRCAPQRSAS